MPVAPRTAAAGARATRRHTQQGPHRPTVTQRRRIERSWQSFLWSTTNWASARLLSEILTDEGHTVELAENAAQARAVRERMRPDLVLLDIWMPDVDGISLLKEWGSHGAADACR